MKCLIINGSPSKGYIWNGEKSTSFTAKLVAEVRDTMERLGEAEFEEIRLADVNLPYCRGCYNCFNSGEDKCPHQALVQPIMQKIREADCLILTSPVYALHISALVKGFFDLTAYNFHRPSFFDKKALVVSSTAGAAAKGACKYMRDTLKHWGFNRVYSLPIIRMGANELSEKMKVRCKDVAARLYKDTVSGRLHSPTYKRLFFFALWKTMSISDTALAADRAYWEGSGLASEVYAPQIKVGVVKRAFGKTLSWMFRRVMK